MTGGNAPLDTKHGQYVVPVLEKAFPCSMTRLSTDIPLQVSRWMGQSRYANNLLLYIIDFVTKNLYPVHPRRGRGHYHLATSDPIDAQAPKPKKVSHPTPSPPIASAPLPAPCTQRSSIRIGDAEPRRFTLCLPLRSHT